MGRRNATAENSSALISLVPMTCTPRGKRLFSNVRQDGKDPKYVCAKYTERSEYNRDTKYFYSEVSPQIFCIKLNFY